MKKWRRGRYLYHSAATLLLLPSSLWKKTACPFPALWKGRRPRGELLHCSLLFLLLFKKIKKRGKSGEKTDVYTLPPLLCFWFSFFGSPFLSLKRRDRSGEKAVLRLLALIFPPIATPITTLFWFSSFPWKRTEGRSQSPGPKTPRTRREWKKRSRDGEKAGIYATWMSSVFWFHSSPEKVQRVEDPFPHVLLGVKPLPSPGLV